MNTTGAVASVHRLICHVSILDHGNKHTFRLSRADVGNPGQRVRQNLRKGIYTGTTLKKLSPTPALIISLLLTPTPPHLRELVCMST